MRLLLIRHGETEHNVAGLLAGISDSRLTNHGVLQTELLANSLVIDRGLRFTNIYSSDLQRAFLTANAVCKMQNKIEGTESGIEVVKLEILREQDFGSLELIPWASQRDPLAPNRRVSNENDPNFKAKETLHSMKHRAGCFVDDFLVPLLALELESEACIAVVSHGLFLSQLWRSFLSRFSPANVAIDSKIAAAVQSFEHISWSNTGYLETEIQTIAPSSLLSSDLTEAGLPSEHNSLFFSQLTLTLKCVNDKSHLLNLKRMRGGIGSAVHDQRQQKIDGFFNTRQSNAVEQNQIHAKEGAAQVHEKQTSSNLADGLSHIHDSNPHIN